LTDTQRIRDLEDALRPFAELDGTPVVDEAWQNCQLMELDGRYKRKSKTVINPADIKRAARVLRGR
jgi:hypothetical protein